MRERLVLLALFLTINAAAQEPRGSIAGRVTDASEAVIPGVAVRATNVETGVVGRAVTNANGAYDLPFLLPGDYRVEAEKAGFKMWRQAGITLRMEDNLRLDIRMEVGAVTETMTVTAESPLLENATGSVSQGIDSQQISELPLRSGSLAWTYAMAPGVVMDSRPYDGPWNIDQASTISIAGSRNYGADYNVDGVSNNSYGGRTAFVPPADMVQEVRINVANYDAGIGHGAGGSVNVSLKSGTNKYHGTANVSGSGGPMMTRNTFTNRQIFDPTTGPITQEKIAENTPDVRWMRYSATVGGPLLIPRIYDGRNRTFWMAGFQAHIRTRPHALLTTVPTKAEREGDFSALLPLGEQYKIYDPLTTTAAPNGRFRRTELPNNIIPANRIDPLARKILGYFPMANAPGTSNGTNNLSVTPAESQALYQPIVRVDHNFSERHRLFARYTHSDFTGHFEQYAPPVRGRLRNRPSRGAALDDVLVLSNSVVLDLRYGFTWFQEHQRFDHQGWDLRTLGFPDSLIRQMDPAGITFPEMAIDNMLLLGNDGGFYQTSYSHSLLGILTVIKGNHTLKFGSDSRALYYNDKTYGNVSPNMTFGSTYTHGPLDNSASAPIGQGLASFLFAIPTGGSSTINDSRAEMSPFYGLYLQDDWRVTRRLTLNLGLRWEYEGAETERFNRGTRDFDFAAVNPIQDAVRAQYAKAPIPEIAPADFKSLGGVRFAGVNGVPRTARDPSWRAFMPRFGFAYQPKRSVVVRGGYGIFFDLLGVEFTHLPQPGFNQATNIVVTNDNGQTYIASISNPFPNGLVPPQGAAGGLKTFLGRAPGFLSADGRRPYAQRWSTTVQWQAMRESIFEIGYIGSRAVRLGVTTDFNPVPPRYLSTLPVRDQPVINDLTRNYQNPFKGIDGFDGSNYYTNNNLQHQQLLKPYPQFSGLTADLPAGMSWYHAFTARFVRRFSRGLQIQANYTWSKNMVANDYLNPTDPAPEHGVAALDRPQKLTVNGMYTLPLRARGRLGQFINGWQAVAIFTGQSGAPLNFTNQPLYSGRYQDMKIPAGDRKPERWFNTAGFEQTSGRQLANNIRTFPSRIATVRADGINVWDLALQKEFRLREGRRLQLRGQAEGAMNHPNYAAPNTNPTNQAFGQVTGTQGSGMEERRIFLGLKYTF